MDWNPLRSLNRSVLRHVRRNAARGMTLVEVLMAGAILAFGMVGILALLGTAHRSHRQAIHETTAVQISQTVFAEYRSLFARGAIPASQLKTVHEDYPDYKYDVKVIDMRMATSRMYPDYGREFLIEVRVYWSDDFDPRKSAVFHTITFLQSQTVHSGSAQSGSGQSGSFDRNPALNTKSLHYRFCKPVTMGGNN